MQSFFGGNPALVLIRLSVISLIVGVMLSALGLSPFDIIESIKAFVVRIYNMGFDAIEWVWRYFLLGAVIVFPIWVVARLFKVSGRSSRGDASLDHKSSRT